MATTNPTSHPVWGEGVRELRILKGLKQAELARAAKTTQGRISSIEIGDRKPDDLLRVRIARALDYDVYELFPYLDENGDVVA